MTRELIGGYPAADDREQLGRFLRYAVPLEPESLTEFLGDLKYDQQVKAPSRH